MSIWLTIRSCIGIALGLLSLLCGVGQIGSIIRVFRRGESISVIPFIGGVSGALAVLILPITGIRRWFWLPLFLDWGAFALLTVMLSRRNTKRAETPKPTATGDA